MIKLNFTQKQIMIALSLVLLSGFFFQNCGQLSIGSDKPNAPAPYETVKDGIILSPGLKEKMKTNQKAGSGPAFVLIPANTLLNFIVDDTCFNDRKVKLSSRYFLDRYFAQFKTPQAGEKFNHSMIQVLLAADLDYESLVRIKKTDQCIVGISNDQGIEFKTSSIDYNDPQAASQTYMQQTGFYDAFPNFNSKLAQQSVTVAVIDSGYDIARGDDIKYADLMVGSDRINNDDQPEDDLGHGTAVASLIASAGNNGKGMVGAAHYVTKLLPLRVIDKAHQDVDLKKVFDAVKHAVNAGADVINLSMGVIAKGADLTCDPVVGHLIYKTIENKTFLVMPAGNYLKDAIVNGTPKPVPGEIFSPKDNSWDNNGNDTFMPGCWGRYFKGALAVTSVDSGGRMPTEFGNWGGDAVEIAAPGVDLLIQDLNGTYKIQSGTSFSTALVTAAVADTIAFYKKQGWYYNPWMIEDTLLNGTPSAATLADGRGPLVRLQKSLNFKALTDYLTLLATKTEDFRRQQFSDNPEAGITRTIAGAPSGRSLIKIDVYSREPILYVKDQAQIQAVAYYDNADMEVVSDRVMWTVDRTSDATISSTGMLYPTQPGLYKVMAKYQGSTGIATISVSNASVVTGISGELLSIETIPMVDAQKTGAGFSFNFLSCDLSSNYITIRATYSDGTIRYVPGGQGTQFFYGKVNGQLISTQNWNASTDGGRPLFYPGRAVVYVTLYRGKRYDLEFTLAANPNTNLSFFANNALSVDTVKKEIRVRKDMEETSARYWTFSKIGNWGIGWPDMQPASYCYVTGAVKRSDLPVPSQRVVNQPYDLSYTSTYWGTGTATPLSLIYKQIPVNDDPVRVDLVHWVTKLPSIDIKDLGMASYLESNLTLTSGSIEKIFGGDLTFKSLDPDPLSQVCFGIAGSPSSNIWAVRDYFKRGVPLPIEVTHKVTGLKTNVTLNSKASDWVAERTESRTLSTPNLTRPPVPAADPRCAAGGSLSPFAAGSGTESDPWLICSLQQLKNIKIAQFKYYVLGSNIDLTPLAVNDLPLNVFSLDGKGYWLSNAALVDAERQFTIFRGGGGSPSQPDVFKNLNFSAMSIRSEVGSFIAGGTYTNVSNIYVENSFIYGSGAPIGDVKLVDHVRVINTELYYDEGTALAGVVTKADSVSFAYFSGKLGFISPASFGYIGGIAGQATKVTDSEARAEIRMGVSKVTIGGIVANASGNVSLYRNRFVGSILGNNTGASGGIIGDALNGVFIGNQVDAQIEGSGATGQIAGTISTTANFFGNVANGTNTGKADSGGIVGGRLEWGHFEDNTSSTIVSCTVGPCGAFVSRVQHLPNCPTLPEFTNNTITSGKANGLSPIGSGPLGNRVAPPGITGDVIPGN